MSKKVLVTDGTVEEVPWGDSFLIVSCGDKRCELVHVVVFKEDEPLVEIGFNKGQLELLTDRLNAVVAAGNMEQEPVPGGTLQH